MFFLWDALKLDLKLLKIDELSIILWMKEKVNMVKKHLQTSNKDIVGHTLHENAVHEIRTFPKTFVGP